MISRASSLWNNRSVRVAIVSDLPRFSQPFTASSWSRWWSSSSLSSRSQFLLTRKEDDDCRLDRGHCWYRGICVGEFGTTTTTLKYPYLSQIRRPYTSRAHPQPKPIYSIVSAVQILLDQASARLERRKQKEERNKVKLGHPDETVELIFQLNLDPRKPNQTLRGSIRLPHGSGKKRKCLVFTEDSEAAREALAVGAVQAGGRDLVDGIANGRIDLEGIDRALGTADMLPVLGQKAARILGPRGLMPNSKVGTLFDTSADLLRGLDSQIMGKDVLYRTEKEGQVLLPVGKVGFGLEKLLDNIAEVTKEIHAVKPETFGKGKTSSKAMGKQVKYVLQAFVSSTQGPGLPLDLRTVDPSSSYFMTDPITFRSNIA